MDCDAGAALVHDTSITDEKDQVIADANVDAQKQAKSTKLPFSKIKNIMKMDPDVSIVGHDAVFVTAKATELFIESLAKEAYAYTSKGKRKTITKKDFDNVIDTLDCLCFLEGAMDF